MENLKTPIREDEPVRSRQTQKEKVRLLEHIAAYVIPAVLLMAITLIVAIVIIFRIAQPEVREFFYYINDEGIAVAQESAEALPTLHQSEQFLQACIRKSFSLNSAEYRSQLKEAHYCFNDVSFREYAEVDAVSVMNGIFTSENPRGYTFVSDMQSRFLFDSTTAPESSNCYAPQIEDLEHAVDCRAFRIDFRQNIRFLGQKVRASKIDRSMLVELFIVPRTRSKNGMYVFRYHELRDQN